MGPGWQFVDSLSDPDRLDVLDLLNRTESALGREAIDEARRRAVVHRRAAEHWLAREDGRLVGYAQVSAGVPPTVEMAGGGVDQGLAGQLLARHGSVDWWVRDHRGEAPYPVVRTLQLLSVDLPVEPRPVPEGYALRTFEVGRDEVTWLEENNAAFADHPEQGAWRRSDLDERVAEPWFDPSGFLLLEGHEGLCASCWTKVHELHPERFGEIYVISVDPRCQGRGLGRVMVTQGLEALRRKGVSKVVLFVDESNVDARALYDRLGFRVEREDRLIRLTA